MARQLRIQYPGAVYHAMCRGNERRDIFRSDEDRMAFLRFLARSLEIYSVKLHAYVLMADHFHLLIETPLGNLSEFMRRFNITYTGFFNRQHQRVGHLYQGRYKSVLVEREAYLSTVSRYIHLNPIRIKSLEEVPAGEKLEGLLQYPWSSLPGYLDHKKQQSMVDYSLVLADFGGVAKIGRDRYLKQIANDIDEDLDIQDKIFSQSILGGEDFVDWVTRAFLAGAQEREQPSAKYIRQHHHQDLVLSIIEEETGKDLDSLKREKGALRRITMDLLYRHGGLKGPAIGGLFDVDYSVVSQERKRLRAHMAGDAKLHNLVRRLEGLLSTNKI